MAYDNTDPRSLLAGAKAPPPVIDYADAETIEFHKIPPSETGPGYKTWYGRGQNIVIAYSEVEPGAVLAREAHCDEYMAFFPDQEIAADIDTSRSEEHTSELQSLMRISYAVFCLKKKNKNYKV